MKRLVAGIATGLLLGVAVATVSAQAMWHESARLDERVTVAGDFAVAAAWSGGAPAWTALFPGASTTPATLRVTSSGAGTTLGWRLSITGTVAAGFSPYTQFAAWAGACGTGTPIPAGGYPATDTLVPGAVVDVCVRYTLAANAPGTLQGQPFVPAIIVTGNQVSG